MVYFFTDENVNGSHRKTKGRSKKTIRGISIARGNVTRRKRERDDTFSAGRGGGRGRSASYKLDRCKPVMFTWADNSFKQPHYITINVFPLSSIHLKKDVSSEVCANVCDDGQHWVTVGLNTQIALESAPRIRSTSITFLICLYVFHKARLMYDTND